MKFHHRGTESTEIVLFFLGRETTTEKKKLTQVLKFLKPKISITEHAKEDTASFFSIPASPPHKPAGWAPVLKKKYSSVPLW